MVYALNGLYRLSVNLKDNTKAGIDCGLTDMGQMEAKHFAGELEKLGIPFTVHPGPSIEILGHTISRKYGTIEIDRADWDKFKTQGGYIDGEPTAIVNKPESVALNTASELLNDFTFSRTPGMEMLTFDTTQNEDGQAVRDGLTAANIPYEFNGGKIVISGAKNLAEVAIQGGDFNGSAQYLENYFSL